MADKKISQLPAPSTPLAGTEKVPALQEGVNVYLTVDQIAANEAADRDAADSALDAKIGTLSSLTTTDKTNLVAALNEVRAAYIAADSSIQSEINAIETGGGLEIDGTYLANGSTHFLGAASSLKDADEILDGEVFTNQQDIATEITDRTNADAAIQAELDATQTGAGLGAGGAYTAPVGSNYLGASNSLKTSDSLLDTEIKTISDAVTAAQAEIDAIETGVGLAVNGTWPAPASNYISASTSAINALVLLDTQIKTNSNSITSIQSEVDTIETAVGLGAGGSLTAFSGTNFIDGITVMKTAITTIDTALSDAYYGTAPLGWISVNADIGYNSSTAICEVNTSTGSHTITMGDPTSLKGRILRIVDISGNATVNNIVIDGGGHTISGSASKTIAVNWGYLEMYCDGTTYIMMSNLLA